jgi:hypothetical protein
MAGQTRRGGVGGISLASGGGAGGRGVAVGEGGKARGNQEPTGLGSLARSIDRSEEGDGRTHARLWTFPGIQGVSFLRTWNWAQKPSIQ